MNPENAKRPRLKDDQVRELIDRLDQVQSARRGACQRKGDRFQYRERALMIEFRRPDGVWEPHIAPTRNLSRRGIGLITGQFVYPRTECRVHLVTVHNHRMLVTGRVARCRYIEGTGSLHEVGIRFDQAIDVAMFQSGVASLRVLLVADDVQMQRLVAHLLRRLDVKLSCVSGGEDAQREALKSEFDFVLLDLDMPQTDGPAICRALIELGFSNPILALTANEDQQTREACESAGFTGCVPKPITPDTLARVVMSIKTAPIISSLANDPEMAPLIDAFVDSLPGKIRSAQQALADGKIDVLARIVTTLKGEGGSYGFDTITRAAMELQCALSGPAEITLIRQKLEELRRWCLAARPAGCEREESAAGG